MNETRHCRRGDHANRAPGQWAGPTLSETLASNDTLFQTAFAQLIAPRRGNHDLPRRPAPMTGQTAPAVPLNGAPA